MRALTLTVKPDRALSPVTGWTRAHWEETFVALVTPLAACASEGGARIRVPGPVSSHGVVASELEGFTRGFMMSAPWLAGSGDMRAPCTTNLAELFARGTLAGTDPDHPEFWGPIHDESQHLVEMAALAWALAVSRDAVWARFGPNERAQVAGYLARTFDARYHDNNWRLFEAVTHAALKRLDAPYRQRAIDASLTAIEAMYVGDGWYGDGAPERIDWYTAWGFHTYALMWAWLDGGSQPARKALHLERARAFLTGLPSFIASDGAYPAMGRSILYRFALVSPIALAALLGCDALPPGQARALASLVTKHFLERPVLTEQGLLAPGLYESKPALLESYSCGASPYWAGRAFDVLLLPPRHAFWTTREEPHVPAVARWQRRELPGPGLITFGGGAHVQLVNQRARGHDPGLDDKYTKLVYSSAFGPLTRLGQRSITPDNAVLVSQGGGLFQGRGPVTPRHLGAGMASSRWGMRDVDPDGWVQTSVVVKDDFTVHLHWVHATRAVIVREGGHALGYDAGVVRAESVPGAEAAHGESRVCYIGALAGWTRGIAARPSWTGVDPRYRHNVVPQLEATCAAGGTALVAIVCARLEATTMERLAGLATCRVEGDAAWITFADGEAVFVQMADARVVDVQVAGRRFVGRVVIARVASDGTWVALDEDGTVSRG